MDEEVKISHGPMGVYSKNNHVKLKRQVDDYLENAGCKKRNERELLDFLWASHMLGLEIRKLESWKCWWI